MLKYIFFLFFIFSLGAGQVLDDSVYIKRDFFKSKPLSDQWFSGDKFLHFSACASICGLTYHFYANRLHRDEDRGKVYAISLTALAGLGKELYDKKKKNHFSWKDLFWDGLGLTAGYFLFVH